MNPALYKNFINVVTVAVRVIKASELMYGVIIASATWVFLFSTILTTWVLFETANTFRLIDIAMGSVGSALQYAAYALNCSLSVDLLGARPPAAWSAVNAERLCFIAWIASSVTLGITAIIAIVVFRKRSHCFYDRKREPASATYSSLIPEAKDQRQSSTIAANTIELVDPSNDTDAVSALNNKTKPAYGLVIRDTVGPSRPASLFKPRYIESPQQIPRLCNAPLLNALDAGDHRLPFIAEPGILPIQGDLIPSLSWGSSLNNLLLKSSWDAIRKPVLEANGMKCEICGSPHKPGAPLECHEAWEYYTPTVGRDGDNSYVGVQKLIKLYSICSDCHEMFHLGFASLNNRLSIALERLRLVNRWTPTEADQYCKWTFALYEFRGHHGCDWALDLSAVSGENLILKGGKTGWSHDDQGWLIRNTENSYGGHSVTYIAGASYQSGGVTFAARDVAPLYDGLV